MYIHVLLKIAGVAASTKLRQTHGALWCPGLSTQEALLGSYLSGKVEYRCVFLRFWPPESVIQCKVGFS